MYCQTNYISFCCYCIHVHSFEIIYTIFSCHSSVLFLWQHTFVSPSAFSRRAVVSYWRKYVHEVLVKCLGGLSLPRKSVVRLTDRPDMTLDVYSGRETTMQQKCNCTISASNFNRQMFWGFLLFFSSKIIFCGVEVEILRDISIRIHVYISRSY